ncbi:LOW QUALITY PROTEIN: paxillin [Carlito syrichta]|uniref:Paxillin n=1 Tax=Carlito syrichta TaxID=1868482 RepID=A0A3Q0ECN1_CARSF|nr:LOW QUALITY PROTEIN: paxillin [Carlito syrichta]
MSSSLGSNLSELDRLLLELNAVQHNPPGFPADETNSSPPLPGALNPHYGVPENNSPVGGKAGPLMKEKPKRNGARGLEDVRPSVESLLDELESSVPSPVPAITVNQSEISSPQRVTSSQQQTRISASSATRELDELMASLSDFKTSSSTVALSSLGLLPSSAPSSHHSLPSSPPLPLSSVFLPSATKPCPRGQVHTLEGPCTKQSGQGFLPHVAPSWLDMAGLRVTPDALNSKSPSVEGSLGPSGTESQAQDWRHLPNLMSELPGAAPCHTVPCAGSADPQEPGGPQGRPANPLCSEKTMAATWEQPWTMEVFRPETPHGAAHSFHEATEPAVVAVDHQAIFPNTWNLMEERDPWKERTRPESERLGSSCPAPFDMEQLDREMPKKGSLVGLTQELKTPRRPEGTTEAAIEAREEQPELPRATAMDTPRITERISTSSQIRSVIRRSRETGHAHPMSREPSPRRRLDPATLSRTPSQERLIAELQGRLGLQLEAEEAAEASAQDWLTEGIVITVQPHGRRAGGQIVDKVAGRCQGLGLGQDQAAEVQVLSWPQRWLEGRFRVVGWFLRLVALWGWPHSWCQSGKAHGEPGVPLPPPLSGEVPYDEDVQGLTPPTPAPHTVRSVGCQTDEDPLFPPMQEVNCPYAFLWCLPAIPLFPDYPLGLPQIQGLEQKADKELCWAAGWPPDDGQSSPGGQDEGGVTWPLVEVVLLASISPFAQEGEKSSHPTISALVLRHRTLSLTSPDQSPSLSPQFMAQGKTGSSSPPGGPPKPGSQLDSMLGSLQSDLNKLGVATVAKGVCGACKKPIAGQVVTAMGKTWHPEHFVCTHCQEEIGSRNFFERDGQPYCEKDYHNLFSPRCYYCNGPILDKVVTALDRTWHPEHFFCAQCGAFFGPEGFHEKDGKAYCRKDYFDMFAPKCGGCARAILENYISALNTLWHPECFVCRECFTPFVNGSFFEHDGQPYCEVHYHERRGSLCSGCQKPITGRCITAMAKKFHPEHFVCAFCLKQLNKGTFKEQNDKPYCQNCFLKLFC